MKLPGHQTNNDSQKTLTPVIWRSVIEVVFIIFLFYSNLLMGEFTHSGNARNKGLLWAIDDVFTIPNFIIAVIAALIGHFVFGYVRRMCEKRKE